MPPNGLQLHPLRRKFRRNVPGGETGRRDDRKGEKKEMGRKRWSDAGTSKEKRKGGKTSSELQQKFRIRENIIRERDGNDDDSIKHDNDNNKSR